MVMNSDFDFYFSGSIFFVILEKANKQGNKKAANNKVLFEDLLRVFLLTPLGSDLDVDLKNIDVRLSNYRKGSDNMPNAVFGNLERVGRFDEDVKSPLPESLDIMKALVAKDIDKAQFDLIVKCIIDMVEKDQTIPMTDKFYIFGNGDSVSKKKLCDKIKFGTVIIEPFLLGIWHYIVTHRNRNEASRDTYNSLFTDDAYVRKMAKAQWTSKIVTDSNASPAEKSDYKKNAEYPLETDVSKIRLSPEDKRIFDEFVNDTKKLSLIVMHKEFWKNGLTKYELVYEYKRVELDWKERYKIIKNEQLRRLISGILERLSNMMPLLDDVGENFESLINQKNELQKYLNGLTSDAWFDPSKY